MVKLSTGEYVASVLPQGEQKEENDICSTFKPILEQHLPLKAFILIKSSLEFLFSICK